MNSPSSVRPLTRPSHRYRRDAIMNAAMAKSMSLNMASGTSDMLKQGHKSIEGLDEAVLKNIEAAKVHWAWPCV